jgi:hypothetical protein
MRTARGVASRVVTALVCAGVVLAPQMVGASPATITLVSGGGAVGTADPATQMSFDGGATFQPALIIVPNSAYSVIPGTRYVSDASGGLARQRTTTLFRTTFTLPAGFQDPSITVQVHADNAVRVVLNGTQIGAQPNAEIFPNFQNPAESYTASGPFVAGVNTLDFFVRNFSGPMGLDYKAVITYATNEPPTLDLPADMTVDATSPTGATVSYSVTATDDNDPSPDVVCSPLSGSIFPVGTTVVSCTATDDDGLIDSGSFSVTVVGAEGQLADLLASVDGVGPSKSLAAKVRNAQDALARGDTEAACNILGAFINEAEAQSGKSLTSATAAQLIADATQIRAVLGCNS